jgi:hypothetical protein
MREYTGYLVVDNVNKGQQVNSVQYLHIYIPGYLSKDKFKIEDEKCNMRVHVKCSNVNILMRNTQQVTVKAKMIGQR